MKKDKKTFFVILVIILALLFFYMVLVHAVFYESVDEINLPISLPSVVSLPESLTNQEVTTVVKNAKKVFPDFYPQQLRIPSIKVKAKVQYVGITKSGKMATPNNFTDVGWFQPGTIPGEKGSAVIAGHVDNGLAFPAVFGSLHQLKVGDDIYIDTVIGEIVHFKVISFKKYDPLAPTEEIFNQNDGIFLKLITCTGTWSTLLRSHNERLVVVAEKI